MSKLIAIAFLILIASVCYNKLVKNNQHPKSIISLSSQDSSSQDNYTNHVNFSCDGKTYCSEMISCEEAKFYQNNCTGTKMDGDGDGVPCERQWCTW